MKDNLKKTIGVPNQIEETKNTSRYLTHIPWQIRGAKSAATHSFRTKSRTNSSFSQGSGSILEAPGNNRSQIMQDSDRKEFS